MKVLIVSKDGREIARTVVRSAFLLVGRSPSCDLVLRAKGVAPVHFMLEWVGVGDPSGGDGIWSVFDVSGTQIAKESASREAGVGEGVVIDDKPVAFCGFEFAWREDRLAESSLEGRVISGAFHERRRKDRRSDRGDSPPPTMPAKGFQLEVVTINSDSGSVSDIVHIEKSLAGPVVAIVQAPELKVEWKAEAAGAMVNIDAFKLKDARIFQRGVELGGASKNAQLAPGDLIQIHVPWQMRDHYFRLVPKVAVPPVRLSVVKDPYYATIAAGFILAMFAIFILQLPHFKKEEPLPEPPRIAKIEVKEVAPPPPVPVAPTQQKQESAKDKAPVVDNQKTAPDAASGSKFSQNKTPPKKPNPGLDSPAPKANVNQVGLLGALKPKASGNVKADKVINDAIVSQNVAGAQGFVVQQPPSGRLGRNDTPGKDLSSAYTTLNVGDSVNSKAGGPIVAADGSGSGWVMKYSKGGTGSGEDGESGFSTDGGLDKDSVRAALAAYRKDIRTCYERALVGRPRIRGRIVYKWRIHPAGTVEWVQLQNSTVDSPVLTDCVKDVIKTVKFPTAAKPTLVIYPFEFQTRN